jgi:hypothetical protein
MGRHGFVKTEFLLFIVCFVAHARTPGFIGIKTTACTTASANTSSAAVACVFVATTRCVPVVPVLELAQLGVEPAFDACGRRAGVV